MKFRFRNSLCRLYCISRVDTEEDDQDFRSLDSAVYTLETVVFLLRSKRPFHCCGSYTGKFFLDHADRGCGFSLPAFLREWIWTTDRQPEGGHESVRVHSFWKTLHNLCRNRTLWTQNLVFFQKSAVSLPWRLFFVSPETGFAKQFGGFLLSYAKILKFYDAGNQNIRFVSTNLRQSLI